MSPKRERGVGIGRKLAIYLPKQDEFLFDHIEKTMEVRGKDGYHTSLSFELIRLAKLGVRAQANPKAMSLLEKS